MRRDRIAAQLYTLRDHLKVPADIAATLKRVREIGYPAVQISGMGPIAEEELVRICDGEGLVICATHEPARAIVEEPERVVERLNRLGCRYTAYPHPHLPLETLAQVRELAALLDHSGSILAAAGQTLGYHNHASELRHFEGRSILEHLYMLTDPSHLQGEIDTHWIQAGGASPTRWCEKLKGRLPLIHLKDFVIGPDQERRFAEIGHGNLDWETILPAAKAAGTEWWIVEQDTCYGEDPFACLARSLEFLHQHCLD